jgi:hypothetical protein
MVFGCVIVLLNTYDGCHVAGVVRERGTPYNGCMVSRTSSGILPASLHVQASGIPPTIVSLAKYDSTLLVQVISEVNDVSHQHIRDSQELGESTVCCEGGQSSQSSIGRRCVVHSLWYTCILPVEPKIVNCMFHNSSITFYPLPLCTTHMRMWRWLCSAPSQVQGTKRNSVNSRVKVSNQKSNLPYSLNQTQCPALPHSH